MLIYIDKDDLFFICSDERSYAKCAELLTGGNSNERALYQFFVKLLSHDAGRIERLETSITKAEDNALRERQRPVHRRRSQAFHDHRQQSRPFLGERR